MPVTQDDFPDIPKVTPVSPQFTANALTPTGIVEFAVALKVPMSGIPELDAMIRESRRLDMATEFLAHRTQQADYALQVADARLGRSALTGMLCGNPTTEKEDDDELERRSRPDSPLQGVRSIVALLAAP